MTVIELIARLQELDPELPVYINARNLKGIKLDVSDVLLDNDDQGQYVDIVNE